MAGKSSFNMTRRLTETAVMIALATALSYIILFPKAFGGSLTLFSQVPIIIIGYRYGAKWGCITGLLHGTLQMILQGMGNFSYVKGIASYLVLIFADYLIAFMVLGLGGGMFRKIRNQSVALAVGAFAGSMMRYGCHFISGVTIWGEYASGFKHVWAYSAVYNGSYMLPEALLSIIGVVGLSLILDFKKENLIRKRK